MKRTVCALALVGVAGCSSVLGFEDWSDPEGLSAGATDSATGAGGAAGGGMSASAGGGGAMASSASSSGGGCEVEADCPAGTGVCMVPHCDDGSCNYVVALEGEPAFVQTPGDCKTTVCDGGDHHHDEAAEDDAPVPTEQCQSGYCDGDTPNVAPVAKGTACDQGGGHRCDGAGNCVECVSDADCPVGVTCAGGSCAM